MRFMKRTIELTEQEQSIIENAMKCDIKMRTFILIEESLRKELQS